MPRCVVTNDASEERECRGAGHDHEDGRNDRADLDPFVDPPRALNDQMVAIDRHGHAVGFADLAGLEGECAVSPQEEGVDRRFQQLLVATVDGRATRRSGNARTRT